MLHRIVRCVFSAKVAAVTVAFMHAFSVAADHGGSTHMNVNLSVPATSTGDYDVTWDNSGALLFELEEDDGDGFGYEQVYLGTGAIYSVQGAASGTYTYRLKHTMTIFGNTTVYYSEPVSVVVSAGPPDTPGAINGPGNDTDGSFTLTWSGSTGATDYELEWDAGVSNWQQVQYNPATSYSESGLSNGTYKYRVRACNSGGCSNWTSTKTVTVGPPPPATIETPPAAAGFQDPGASSSSDAIGSTAGNFRVSENGTATYSIPLAVPEGTAGVKPSLSLNYSGTTQNGIAGIGWSIGGLSAITRCRQTLEQDGQSKPITFTSDDRFCLDGQRLLLDSTGNYGDANTVYKTEIESGATVTARQVVNGGPSYFEVRREDGSLSYYGQTSTDSGGNAKLANPNGEVLTWGLREYRDSAGNSIWFDYDSSGSTAQRIKDVKYAYGSLVGPGGHNARVEFVYDTVDRPDPITGFVGGHLFENKKRLERIKVWNAVDGPEQVIREYVTDYQSATTVPTDALTRLQGLQECANNVCLSNDTTFVWNLPMASPYTKTFANMSLESGSTSYVLTTQLADINGDSQMDIIWFYGSPGSYEIVPYLKYAISHGSNYTVQSFDNGSTEVPFTIRANQTQPDKIVPIDYNADGRQDLAIYDRGSAEWKIHLSMLQTDGSWKLSATPVSGLQLNEHISDFIDLNSDGLVDMVEWWPNDEHTGHHYHVNLMQKSGDPTSSTTYYGFDPVADVHAMPFQMGAAHRREVVSGAPDFDGDGMVDQLLFGWTGGQGGYSLLKAFNNLTTGVTMFSDLTAEDPNYLIIEGDAATADLNGDGLTDVIYGVEPGTAPKAGYQLRLSNGVSFEAPTLLAVGDVEFVQTADWNNDGFADIVWRDESSTHKLTISYWNPTNQSFNAPVFLTSLPGNGNEYATIVDINGDGVDDLLHIAPSGDSTVIKPKIRYESSAANAPVANFAVNRINKITNGLGAETDISHEPLSTSDHYDRLEKTSTQIVQHCWPAGPGEPEDCIDVSVEVHDVGAFYDVLNGPWWIPNNGPTLGKEQYGAPKPAFEMAGAYYVVTDVLGSAPAAGALPGAVDNSAKSSISYRYSEARIQAGGRGFLGFMQLTSIDNQTNVETITRYRQDWPFIGMPIGTAVKSAAGNDISISATDWEILEWGTTYEAEYKTNGSAAAGPVHVVQSGTLEENYALVNNGATQGVLMSTIESTTTYVPAPNPDDMVDNPDLITVVTKDGNGTVLRTVVTDNDYDSAFPASEARLSYTRVDTTGGSLPMLTRESSFTYYSGTPNQQGSKYGLLWTETIEPNDVNFTVQTTHSYDSWGNRVRSKVLGGGETRCDVDVVDYDALTGRYADLTRDCLGRTTSVVTQRNEFGQPTVQQTYVSSIDYTTSRTWYGALGRPYYSHHESGASTTTYLSTSLQNCPSSAVISSTSTEAGGAVSAACTDILGRTVREMTQSFNGGWNVVDTEYDAIGRVKRKSDPYDLYNPDPGAPFWTELDYDLLGRVTNTVLPDGSVGTVAYNGSATGLSTVSTNDKNQSKTEVTNALGQLVDTYRGMYGNQQYGNTHFEYDHQDNLILMRDNAGNETEAFFDKLGRKEWVDDPDKSWGTDCNGNAAKWNYEYNHFGELELQTDAKCQTSTMTYDGLGRIKTRVDRDAGGAIESNVEWAYDTGPFGLGQIDYVEDYKTNYFKAFMYDSLGRLESTATSIGSDTYHELTTYDQYGRVFQYFDAAGDGVFDDFGTVTKYNAYGYVETIGDALGYSGASRTIYQRVDLMNARGKVTKETRGITNDLPSGAAEVYYDYEFATGRADEIRAYDGVLGYEIQHLEYDWDTVGNLEARREFSGTKNLSETFGYDDLNRLETYGIPSLPQTITYDANHIGNIVSKTGVTGSYGYGDGLTAGPHAVVSFNGNSLTYDQNGNLTNDGSRAITYSAFNKPTTISVSGHTTEFKYGPDRARYYRKDIGNGGVTETWYLGNVEIVNRPDSKQERRRYIAGVAIETTIYSGATEDSRTTRYLFHDHLGSIDAITDDQGGNVVYQSFNAWGERRSGIDWTQPIALAQLNPITSITDRGFTGHEMLDEVGLIHMNGRIYDPLMARFVQADPFVEDPTNSQSLNRYSYVWNNPLNATDPSGHFVSLLVGAILYKMKVDMAWAVLALMASSAAEVAIAGGGIGDMFSAAMSTAAFSSIGAAFGGFDFGFNFETFRFVVASGVMGGITSMTAGGSFGHGFRSTAIGSVAGGIFGRIAGGIKNDAVRFLGQVIAGGTASELSGGKFRNGALAAAFKSFERGVADYSTEGKLGPDRFSDEQKQTIKDQIDTAASKAPKNGFEFEEDAAKFLHKHIQPIASEHDIEIASHIFGDTEGRYRFTAPVTGFYNYYVPISLFRPRLGHAPFHTHQTISDFSDNDYSFAERSRAAGYLSNAFGLFKYDSPGFRLAYNMAKLMGTEYPRRKQFYEPVQ